MSLCGYVHESANDLVVRKRVLATLELESQVVVLS